MLTPKQIEKLPYGQLVLARHHSHPSHFVDACSFFDLVASGPEKLHRIDQPRLDCCRRHIWTAVD